MELKLPDLVSAQAHFERWIKTSVNPEWLSMCNEIIPDYFNQKRYPTETSNAIYLAKVALLIELENRVKDLSMEPA